MRVVAIVIGAVIAVALLWGAGEYHYRNCTNAAKARTEPGALSEREKFDEFARKLGDKESAREKAIEGCSRLPF